MINRINLILRAKNISARQFAEEIGIQPSGMSHILGGRNNPSLEFVTKVIRRYPEIDANWLLLGRGEMYTAASEGHQTALPPASPTLQELPFDEPLPQPQEQPAPLPDIDEETFSEPEAPEPAHNYEELPPVDSTDEAVPTGRRLQRILFIYSDNTFAEYLPQK